jgi:hypothetical protein
MAGCKGKKNPITLPSPGKHIQNMLPSLNVPASGVGGIGEAEVASVI